MISGSFVRHGVGSLLAALVVTIGCSSSVTQEGPSGSGGSGGEPWGTSSSSSGGNGGTGGMGTGGDGGGILATCTGGNDVVLVVDHLFIGDTDPDGTANSANGWKQYGYDIDGKISTKTSTDLCKPSSGGTTAAAYPDGDNGIDNAFGKNILPILLALFADLSIQVNDSIAMGQYSYMLAIPNVGPNPCLTSSDWFAAGQLGMTPAFDGSDVWPIDPKSLLVMTDPTSTQWKFNLTNVANGTVVTGPIPKFEITLKASSMDFVLPIRLPRLHTQLSADQKSTTNGQIGGVIDTEEFVAEIAKVAAAFDPSFCDPNSPTLVSILNQIRQASDIMNDGTQDPSKTCNGISIGLGFTMKSVQLGPIAAPTPPPPNPCTP